MFESTAFCKGHQLKRSISAAIAAFFVPALQFSLPCLAHARKLGPTQNSVMRFRMLSAFKNYWKSKAANIHGVLALLSGASGLTTLEALNVHDTAAKAICAAAVVIGAFLYTPDSK